MDGQVRNRHIASQASQQEFEISSFTDEVPDFSYTNDDSAHATIANGNAKAGPVPTQRIEQMDEELNPTFPPPTVVPSNRDDPERRPREFAARHVQMMALGTT